MDKLIYGLTKWESSVKSKGIVSPAMVKITAEDYEKALGDMNNLFL